MMMTIYLLRIRLAGNGWSKPGALIGDIGAMRPVLQDMRSLRDTKYHNVHMLRCAHASIMIVHKGKVLPVVHRCIGVSSR